MREEEPGPVLDRRELPGDAGPCPLRHGASPVNPVNFLSGVQFGHLKPKDTVPPLPKAKLSKRAHLWFGIQIVGPPASDFVLLGQGVEDAPWGCCNGKFFYNG